MPTSINRPPKVLTKSLTFAKPDILPQENTLFTMELIDSIIPATGV